MSSILHIDTNNVNPSQRLAYWNDHVGSIYGGMSVDSKVDSFSARLVYADVGKVGFMRACSSHSLVNRSGDNHQAETVLVHLQARGESVNCQGNRWVHLKPGDFTICENRSRYTIEPSGNSDIIALEIPLELARHYIPDIGNRIIYHYSCHSLAGRLLFGMLQSIQSEVEQGAGSDALNLAALEPALLDLLVPLVSSPETSADVASRRGRSGHQLAKLKMLVQQYLAEENLGGEMLAGLIGLSERRVQVLFASEGTTPVVFIRNARLAWAAERLRHEQGCSITTIAHDAGFSDSTYFARCFRKRYGCSPRTYRTAS